MKDTSARKLLVLIILLFLFNNIFITAYGKFNEESYIDNKIELFDDDFDNAIMNYMKNGNLPSLASAIIKNGNIVWLKCYGYSDIKNKKVPSNETVYMLASISKTFAATAIMQLYEKGILGLDDDINDYLPFNVRNPNYPDIPITFRMILTHSSSIAERKIKLFTLFSILNIPFDYFDEYLNPVSILYSPSNWYDFPPGEQQRYSSAGFDLLGYLVECITNQSFPEYCNENIFIPLDMKNTSYDLSDYYQEQLAVQYIYLFGKYIALPNFEVENYGSGGLRSNLEDLSHYLIAYMNGGEYKGVRILKNETIELMFTNQNPSENFIGYGLGWQIFPDHYGSQDSSRIGHNGEMPGDITYMFYHVSQDFGLIILSNQHLYYRLNEISNWFSIISLLSEKALEY